MVYSGGRALRSRRPKPSECLLTIEEPLRRKNGRALDGLLARSGEPGWHEEREPSDTSRSVARDDVSVAPLHHSVPEAMLELHRIDEQRAGPRLLCFPDEKAERGHEAPIRHACRGRKPSELQQVRVLNDDAPFV